MSKVKSAIVLNLDRFEGEGKLPLRIKFDIYLAADDPRQETIYDSVGKFLAEVLTPGDAQELLRQWKEKYGALGASATASGDSREQQTEIECDCLCEMCHAGDHRFCYGRKPCLKGVRIAKS